MMYGVQNDQPPPKKEKNESTTRMPDKIKVRKNLGQIIDKICMYISLPNVFKFVLFSQVLVNKEVGQ